MRLLSSTNAESPYGQPDAQEYASEANAVSIDLLDLVVEQLLVNDREPDGEWGPGPNIEACPDGEVRAIRRIVVTAVGPAAVQAKTGTDVRRHPWRHSEPLTES